MGTRMRLADSPAPGMPNAAALHAQAKADGTGIRVRGIVQGVGFRPTVWRLARDCGLSGDIRNDGQGVMIRAWGSAAARASFLRRLRAEAPPMSRIDAIDVTSLTAPSPGGEFMIGPSESGEVHTGVAADAATCAACLTEIGDSNNRRYHHPFTNCTHCGPRLSIVYRVPYDRANTSMDRFPMCEQCRREYDNPANRRFHAQPTVCPRCGPHLWLEATRNLALDLQGDPIEVTQRLLREGHIVAIKGLGGFHLACLASCPDAVLELRRRKHRDDKPFALMARDTAMIRRYCRLEAWHEKVLRSPAAPIMLLDAAEPEQLARPAQLAQLAPDIAPGLLTYGFMLPYTPLHHLLMATLDAPIVLTSGNRAEEPQCISNDEAREKLDDIADACLLHDRDIVNRLDDSVVRPIAGQAALLRRARGYAPTPLRLPEGFRHAPHVLAFGSEFKNTFCLTRDGEAILSQHLGDLEHPAARAAASQTRERYRQLFDHHPQAVVIDSHPAYQVSQSGRAWATGNRLPLVTVQHHHAHIAAALVEHGVDIDSAPVLGLALDGTGYGEDGTVWGGEFLLADYRGYRRLASLAPVAMPGAAQAIRQPWRMAYAHLSRVCDWPQLAHDCAALPFFSTMADKPVATLAAMIANSINSPLTTSCGRLFDAVAAVVVGLRQSVSYDGQAATELEAAVDHSALADGADYPFVIKLIDGLPRLDPQPMWHRLLHDLRASVPAGTIAARFHAGLARGLTQMVGHLHVKHGNAWNCRIVLSGGVLQNAVLTGEIATRLRAYGLEVLMPVQVPANDGGLSLGQAAVAAARLMTADNAGPTREAPTSCA